MPTLGDHLRKRPTNRERNEAAARKVFEITVENAAAKKLLADALAVLGHEEEAPPVLTVMERIKTFLERHP